MVQEIVEAGGVIAFQRWLRVRNMILIRATPFRNKEGVDCYRMSYISLGEKS